MTTAKQLLHHAVRCNKLAQDCHDASVAQRLQRLADEYWSLLDQRLGEDDKPKRDEPIDPVA